MMQQASSWQFIEAMIAEDAAAAPAGLSGYHVGDDSAESYVLLAILLGSVTALLLLLWKALSVPGGLGRALTYRFSCPVLGREVIAEFQLDPAEKGPIDVIWCTASRPAAVVTCTRHCLKQGLVGGVIAARAIDTVKAR